MGKKDAKAVNMGKMEDIFTALASFFPKCLKMFMYLYYYMDNLFMGTNLLAPLAGTPSKPGARSKTQRLCLEMGKNAPRPN